jgi:hypothetical protein
VTLPLIGAHDRRFHMPGVTAVPGLPAAPFASPAAAGPVLRLDSSGKITGINGLVVGTRIFNATFSPGGLSYDAAVRSLAIPPSFGFDTLAQATDAAAAITHLFNNHDPKVTGFDFAFAVDSGTFADAIVVPFGGNSDAVHYMWTAWRPDWSPSIDLTVWSLMFEAARPGNRAFTPSLSVAFFTPVPVSTPDPRPRLHAPATRHKRGQARRRRRRRR